MTFRQVPWLFYYLEELSSIPLLLLLLLLLSSSFPLVHGCTYSNTPVAFEEDAFRPHTDLSQLVFRGFPAFPGNTTDFDGFATVLSTICRGTIEDKSLWIFRILDRDGKGTVSNTDIASAFEVLISFVQFITGQEEGNTAEIAELKTNEIFDFLGKGKEERISNEDLLNWIKGNEEVIKHLDIFLNKV